MERAARLEDEPVVDDAERVTVFWLHIMLNSNAVLWHLTPFRDLLNLPQCPMRQWHRAGVHFKKLCEGEAFVRHHLLHRPNGIIHHVHFDTVNEIVAVNQPLNLVAQHVDVSLIPPLSQLVVWIGD